jgi:hypothetical protein
MMMAVPDADSPIGRDDEGLGMAAVVDGRDGQARYDPDAADHRQQGGRGQELEAGLASGSA